MNYSEIIYMYKLIMAIGEKASIVKYDDDSYLKMK